MSENPVDAELEKMAGSPQVAKVVRASLERLKSGVAGPEMAEMARDVLGGNTSLRQVGSSSAYALQFADVVDRFKAWQESLTAEQRHQFEEAGRAGLSDDRTDDATS